MGAKSLGEAEYFLAFIDDNTHYVWVYVLKHKDEVFGKFLEWKALVEKSSGRKLKVFRTDNGGEFTSAKFENYLKKGGITHQLSVPKTPEQNGVAERMNRTLVESVRSMLADAKLPHNYWAETLSTATYLRNIRRSTAVKGKTPFEAWTSRKPNVKHLRVFGCDACMLMCQKMNERNLSLKLENAFFLAMAPKRKVIVFMTQNVQESFIVAMFSLTNINKKLTWSKNKSQYITHKWSLTFLSLKKLLSTKSLL